MKGLRRWTISRNDPHALQIAADARLSHTQYTDDQSWQVRLGGVDEPAINVESTYGGRIKSVTLVPAIAVQGRLIYLTQAFAKPPVVTSFAPGFIELEAALTAELRLRFEIWVMESQAVGGRFILTNRSDSDITVTPQLIAHVDASPHRMPLANLPLSGSDWGLSMGRLPGFEPVLLLEGGQPDVRGSRKREHFIASENLLAADDRLTVRWCHVGLDTRSNSAARAQRWLSEDWQHALDEIVSQAAAIPDIQTENPDFDAVIAFSGMQLTQAFLGPTGQLRGPSLVATRQPAKGFSKRGDGRDQPRGWQGQDPFLAYMLAQFAATVHPRFAQALVENYCSIQADDGFIDMAPGLAGQRTGLLSPPILAQVAWNIYELSGDREFVDRVYPALLSFLNRWFETDLDVDLDAAPEWQDPRQTGYIFWPTFAPTQPWSVGMDIKYVESPDLAAYLLTEATALQRMATLLDDPGANELAGRISALEQNLQRMWFEEANRFAYRERDTGVTTAGVSLITDAPAYEAHILAFQFDDPGRVIIRIAGGGSSIPNATLYIDGDDERGNKIQETVPLTQFQWGHSLGTYTSNQVFSAVHLVRIEGLSRVFKISVFTADLTRADINGLMPLIVAGLPESQIAALISELSSERFLRPSGLTIVAANDPDFDPASAEGGGGTWVYWTMRLCEALLAKGQYELATDVMKRLLRTQVEALRIDKRFPEFYHSDEARGLGERGHIAGAFPVMTFLRLIGAMVIDSHRVYAGGPFTWDGPVTVRQHGVEVLRSANGSKISFPSGYEITLDSDAPWQFITDTGLQNENENHH